VDESLWSGLVSFRYRHDVLMHAADRKHFARCGNPSDKVT
jgi:hypothetical protein